MLNSKTCYIISQTKDTTIYQTADTKEVFKAINRVDGLLDIYTLTAGNWVYQMVIDRAFITTATAVPSAPALVPAIVKHLDPKVAQHLDSFDHMVISSDARQVLSDIRMSETPKEAIETRLAVELATKNYLAVHGTWQPDPPIVDPIWG